MSKFIYFDIGGVLLEYKNALQEMADENGITVDDFQRIYERYGHAAERGEMTLHDLWIIYKEELHLKEDSNFDFPGYWTDHLLPIPENHDVLKTLATSHRVGILSNIYEGVMPTLILKKKIPDVSYATIIESCEVRCLKPDERIYQIAQHATGLPPTEIVYIDDRQEFVEFAKTLGWNGVWYEKGNGVNLTEALAQFIS
jgi:FMN phosphatase YigB (HAD superfamily)